mgnify:CR=1 FL=1
MIKRYIKQLLMKALDERSIGFVEYATFLHTKPFTFILFEQDRVQVINNREIYDIKYSDPEMVMRVINHMSTR